MFFNNKFYVFASQMEPLHSICKSYVFRLILEWVDDTEMKYPLNSILIYLKYNSHSFYIGLCLAGIFPYSDYKASKGEPML